MFSHLTHKTDVTMTFTGPDKREMMVIFDFECSVPLFSTKSENLQYVQYAGRIVLGGMVLIERGESP